MRIERPIFIEEERSGMNDLDFGIRAGDEIRIENGTESAFGMMIFRIRFEIGHDGE